MDSLTLKKGCNKFDKVIFYPKIYLDKTDQVKRVLIIYYF